MSDNQILIYKSEEGSVKIDIQVQLNNGNIWLNQKQLENLYQTTKQNISLHLKNIFNERELDENLTVKEYLTVQAEGKREVRRKIKIYNLDVIIAVGYRVNSHIATQFRIWATQVLKEYLIKGFALNDEKLKNNNQPKYFNELLDRIRDIRSSEKIFYQKVKDIYKTSIDYDSDSEVTQSFFAKVQNKLHWAIHQHTAAELIYERVNAEKPNMGLTNWKQGRIKKGDITIAKNYLQEEELKKLNLLVEQYLAFAEMQAMDQKVMYMTDWSKKLDDILTINGKEILKTAGRISAKMAKELAEGEFQKYSVKQKELENIESLRELEEDIAKIKKVTKKVTLKNNLKAIRLN